MSVPGKSLGGSNVGESKGIPYASDFRGVGGGEDGFFGDAGVGGRGGFDDFDGGSGGFGCCDFYFFAHGEFGGECGSSGDGESRCSGEKGGEDCELHDDCVYRRGGGGGWLTSST